MTTAAVKELSNENIVDAFTGNDMKLRKEAQDMASDFLQAKAREDILTYAIVNDEPITKDDLDTQVDMEEPTVIFEKEPDTPAPVPIPFGTQSEAITISGNRGLVIEEVVGTPHMRKDKFKLMTYKNDIREILTDNLLYDIGETIDLSFFAMVDAALGGAPGTELAMAGGVPLWKEISGGLTPDTWVQMMQILPDADSRFRPATVVMNQSLAYNLLGWDSDQLSDSLMEELNRRGWVADEFKGVKLIITIKNNVVEKDEIYLFAGEDKVGKTYVLDDVTMYSDAKGRMLEWWSETVTGTTIQPIGCAKVTLV